MKKLKKKGESTIAQRKHYVSSLSLKNKALPLFLLCNALVVFYISLTQTLPFISEMMDSER